LDSDSDLYLYLTIYLLQIELPPPQLLRERSSDVLLNRNEVHQYRQRFGEDEFRNGIVQFVKAHYNLRVPKDSILGKYESDESDESDESGVNQIFSPSFFFSLQTATSGVCAGLVSTMQWIRETRGEHCRIGLMTPFYTYHLMQIRTVTQRDPIFVNCNADMSVDWKNVEKAFADGLDLLVLCNPGNPQG
jgi:aspartate/methionine/tyrosine aminotransferase